MVTVMEIYQHCKTNNKPMLMSNENNTYYPKLKDNTSNFITDYLANYKKIDKAFAQKFKDKKIMLFSDVTTFPSIYNDWIESCDDFVFYYLESWSRLYFALADPATNYNPTWNYDGHNLTHTVGKTLGESGTDLYTDTMGAVHNETKNYNVPNDSTNEEEVAKSTGDSNEVVNSKSLQFGKSNNVDYTVDETKGGNQGTTSTQSLLQESIELAKTSFWDMVCNTLSKELTRW